jgi:FkbM family methyltransferase
MNTDTREKIITTIIEREKLRSLGRFSRLTKDPVRALPYYLLALRARIQPFPISFNTLWDTRMTCYLPEGNTFYYYGYCEANLTNFFLRYVQEGMTCLDVGAHVGIYSMLFSELAGKTGSVHSFEPTPWTFKILTGNTKSLQNVTLNNSAVAETERTLEFADYGPGYGAYNSAHTSGAPALNATPQMSEVQSLRLDTYCEEKGLTPDIIKIDSEGFEFEALSGSSSLLTKRGHRPLLSIEVANGEDWSENREAAFALLKESDYVAFSITTEGFLTEHTDTMSYEYDNLLFVPKERMDAVNQFLV